MRGGLLRSTTALVCQSTRNKNQMVLTLNFQRKLVSVFVNFFNYLEKYICIGKFQGLPQHSTYFQYLLNIDQRKGMDLKHSMSIRTVSSWCLASAGINWFMGCLGRAILLTIRTNLLNWCNLVSISKNIVFYAFLVVRIY